MDIKENNSQINNFAGGMDTDTSDMLLKDGQYRLANNVRYITNTKSNTGELHLIDGATVVSGYNGTGDIIATTTIRQWGVFIWSDEQAWGVIRFHKDEPTNLIDVIGSCSTPLSEKTKPSLVTRWEDEDNVKLYIADGEHPLMSINIMNNYGSDVDITNIQAYSSGLLLPPKFQGWTTGILKSGMVQYAYMLYQKHGKCTTLSPITKLIQLPADAEAIGKAVEGQEVDKETTCGVKLQIDIEDPRINNYFDHILVYRIHYVTNGQTPTIELIVDQKRPANQTNITILDSGQNALDSLTLEEFNSISGIHIIPKVIESKNDYLFAANIRDVSYTGDLKTEDGEDYDARAFQFNPQGKIVLTEYSSGESTEYENVSDVPLDCDAYNTFNNINERKYPIASTDCVLDGKNGYYGGIGPNISWRFITTAIDGDTCSYNTSDTYYDPIGTRYNIQSLNEANTLDTLQFKYIKYVSSTKSEYEEIDASQISLSDLGIVKGSNNALNYSNPIVSYAFKSLKRDELYRYGIVFYDEDSNPTPVQWIADIRVPEMSVPGFETFISHPKYGENGTIDLGVRPIGIEFKVMNMPKGMKAYEIVRCNRTDSDIATLSQGVLSRPGRRAWIDKDLVNNYPYTPSGFLTTNKFIETIDTYFIGYEDEDADVNAREYQYDNLQNDLLYQFVSPEITYLKDTMSAYLLNKTLHLDSQKFLFGRCAGIRTEEFHNDTVGRLNNQYENTWPDGVYDLPLTILSDDQYRTNDRLSTWWAIIKPSITNLQLLIGAFWGNVENPTYKPSTIYTEYYNDSDGVRQSRVEKGPFTTATLVKSFYILQSLYSRDPHAGSYTTGTFRIPSDLKYTDWPYITESEETDSSDKSYSGDSSYKVPQEAYTYIKLYEQSNQVCTYPHVVNKPGVYGSAVNWGEADDTGNYLKSWVNTNLSISDAQSRFDIDRTKMASELAWDDCQTYNSDNNTYTYSYKDKVDTVGTYSFNNWLSWGRYEETQITWPGAAWYSQHANTEKESTLMGPGGRTLLITLKQLDQYREDAPTGEKVVNNILADTCGTNVIQQYSSTSTTPFELTTATNEGAYATLESRDNRVGSIQLYADSSFGTFLCNLRHNIIPYGGYDYTSRQLNTYYSYGDYHLAEKENSAIVFDGDCYIEPFEYVSLHKFYNKDANTSKLPTFSVIYSIPVETNINLALTNGFEFSRNYQLEGVTNLQIEPSDVNELLVQDEPLYVYNSVYSQNPTVKLFEANIESAQDTASSDMDYRIYYSNRKDNDERMDSWLVFQSANYLDVDTRYGAITELRTFHNNLLFWQEQASGLLSVNERVQITTGSNMPLMLGTGDVLSRYDYFNSKNGMKENEFADAQSDSMLIWWDHNKHELCAYGGEGTGISILSKAKSVQNFLNKQYDENKLLDEPMLSYDKRFNEFLINITNGTDKEAGSLVYSEMSQTFIGLYTITAKYALSFSDKLLLTDTKNIAEWNKGDGNAVWLNTELTPYVKFVVNKSPSTVKVFDNAEFGGRFYEGNVAPLSFKFNTPLKQQGALASSEITDREYSFRFAIPRETINDGWGKRLRGKTMQVELSSSSNSTDFSLQYVINKFRISWS